MENKNLEIPIEIKVDTTDVDSQLSCATGIVLDLLFGKGGLLRPRIKTSFWIGSYLVDIDLE